MSATRVVSSTRESGAEFRRIDRIWRETIRHPNRSVEASLLAFLRGYPEDGQAPRVHVYLAWVYAATQRYTLAERHLGLIREPAARVRDFARFVRASIMLDRGQAEQALSELRELRGILIGTEERLVQTDRLLDAMVATSRYQGLADVLLDWVTLLAASGYRLAAPPSSRLDRFPIGELADVLFEVERTAAQEREARKARQALAVLLREHLERAAIAQRDSELAQRLLELHQTSEDERLEQVAAARPPRISGRRLGLLLELGDERASTESASVLEGVTAALRSLPAEGDQGPALTIAQVTYPASDGVPPNRFDEATALAYREALAELAAEGTGIIIAGISSAGADQAAQWAASSSVPLIVLEPPLPSERRVVPSERTAVAPGGCLFIVGLSDDEAKGQVTKLGHEPAAVLGLRGAPLGTPAGDVGLRVSTGRFPAPAVPHINSQQSWLKTHGTAPSWAESLGHDAALLGSSALASLPGGSIDAPSEVASHHQRLCEELGEAKNEALWLTDQPGFDARQRLPIRLQVVPR